MTSGPATFQGECRSVIAAATQSSGMTPFFFSGLISFLPRRHHNAFDGRHAMFPAADDTACWAQYMTDKPRRAHRHDDDADGASMATMTSGARIPSFLAIFISSAARRVLAIVITREESTAIRRFISRPHGSRMASGDGRALSPCGSRHASRSRRC